MFQLTADTVERIIYAVMTICKGGGNLFRVEAHLLGFARMHPALIIIPAKIGSLRRKGLQALPNLRFRWRDCRSGYEVRLGVSRDQKRWWTSNPTIFFVGFRKLYSTSRHNKMRAGRMENKS
ncbi:hypothetical protein [Desulfatibacillum aliphaticivorans]|uniref:hypothetical protein n=1 Tax=Desulfatibacillum aliphaticivorans TaxID=218208 RepID=UPI0004819397|nr:hypothetical protein [Desulfatibacillum aliphaticivorans]